MMKFALFLVCALVAVQGFQARSVEPVERDLNDIMNSIKAAVDTLKQIFRAVTAQIPELIQNIKDKIKDIPDPRAEIMNKIEALAHHEITWEQLRKCIEAQRTEIEAWIKFAKDGYRACIEEADSKADALRDQLQVLVDKVLDLEETAVQGTLKCANDIKLEPADLVKCLNAVVDTLLAQIFELQGEIANTIHVAKETAQEAGPALARCVLKVHAEAGDMEEEIIYAIRNCL